MLHTRRPAFLPLSFHLLAFPVMPRNMYLHEHTLLSFFSLLVMLNLHHRILFPFCLTNPCFSSKVHLRLTSSKTYLTTSICPNSPGTLTQSSLIPPGISDIHSFVSPEGLSAPWGQRFGLCYYILHTLPVLGTSEASLTTLLFNAVISLKGFFSLSTAVSEQRMSSTMLQGN